MARTSHPRRRRALAAGISLLLAATVGLLPLPACATLLPPLAEPNWMELTEKQREILQPLANDWDQLDDFRRKKWLGIALRYPKLNPDEQQRVQRRMREWAGLSPTERQKIRERYKDLQKVPPEQRAAIKQKWQEYKELPDTEKERLRQQARAKVSSPALAAKPSVKTPLLAPSTAPAAPGAPAVPPPLPAALPATATAAATQPASASATPASPAGIPANTAPR